MNRLYVAEAALSCTGAKADHRLPLRCGEIETLARAIVGKLGVSATPGAAGPAGWHDKWIAAVAKDLEAHRGRSLVLAGDRQPAAVHLLAHALNDRLGNVGQTVNYTAPIDARPGARTQSLRDLVDDIDKKQVELLVILGGNPVYNAPADIDFAKHSNRSPYEYITAFFSTRLLSVPVASAGSPLSGIVERFAGLRRNGIARATADRAALRGAFRPRGDGAIDQVASDSRQTDSSRALAERAGVSPGGGRFRAVVARPCITASFRIPRLNP